MRKHPASMRRQDWATIFFMAALVGVPTFVGFLVFTWSWLMPWPAMGVHALYWLDALNDLVFDQSLAPWRGYWQALVERDWHLAFVGHISAAFALAALLAFLAARRFYVHGGIDGYRHIDGPRRYWFATALRHAKRVYKQEKSKAAKPHEDKLYDGLHLHPQLRISRMRELANLLVIGTPSAVKPWCLRHDE